MNTIYIIAYTMAGIGWIWLIVDVARNKLGKLDRFMVCIGLLLPVLFCIYNVLETIWPS